MMLEQELQINNLCVQAIDSITYDSSYIIHLEDINSGKKMKLLSRKKQITQCINKLKVGNCYEIETIKLKSTSEFTEVGHRLGKYDIYVNDSLVFAVSDYVVKSNQINGLCYYPPKIK